MSGRTPDGSVQYILVTIKWYIILNVTFHHTPPPPTQRQPHVERISLEAICQTRNRNSPVGLDLDTGRVAYWCLTMAHGGESGVCQLRGPVVVKQVPQNHESGVCPASEIHWANAGLMLVQRRRRLTNINAALDQCIVLTGYQLRGPVVVRYLPQNHPMLLFIMSFLSGEHEPLN